MQTDNADGKEVNGKALMALNMRRKDGIFRSTNCYFVFFEDRIVVAVVSGKRMNEEMKKARQQLKEEGKGFLKSSIALLSFWFNYAQRYYPMSADEILAEDPANSSIKNGDVQKIIFKTARDRMARHPGAVTQGEVSRYKEGFMRLMLADRKIKAAHRYRDSNKNIKETLSSLFGSKLKYRGGFSLTINIGGSKDGFN